MKKHRCARAACLCLALALCALLTLPASMVASAASASWEFKRLEGNYNRPELKGTKLNVYNWGEYISDGKEGSMDIIAEFKRLTGIDVTYSNYENNEGLYSVLSGGGGLYDVIIPSDYMIERLISEDRLEKLNFNNIPNYHYILEENRGKYFDPTDEYTVPYTVGMVGIIYNTTLVEEPVTSWRALWDERYTDAILQFDNPRDAFGIAQYILGQDVNTTDPADWEAAAELLKEQRPVLQQYVMDQVFDLMEGGEAALAPYYAGDFNLMHENNPDLAFVYPKEGTNFFYDSICIPKGAAHVEAAELFINFLLEPEVALANANFICYATPHSAVREDPDYDWKDDPILYPAELPANAQYFKNLPQETLDLLNSLWVDVKNDSGTGSSRTLLIALGVAAALGAAALVVVTVRKKKRS
ncbi:MAG: spermidine/putrescine ABC transporter substrate-binding protein [Oscillospiraceae bacterium]|jgi:spermidine/putrescine transport system substrate-binding protein|nr:spermidine/putrescine ABC transporter substrate-binding protein [Oscillospiraceae bacterium]